MKRLVLIILSGIILFAASIAAIAQQPPPPPRPITVTSTRGLSFGSFYQGAAGGTVTITAVGVRSWGGDVVLFGLGVYSSAIFEIVANTGTLISFLQPTATLTDGTHTLNLTINDSGPISPFVTTLPYPNPTQVFIGGTLNIGTPAANPPGNYSGTFDIIFVQE